jgi:peptidylprolyl isomerase/peptidyl-prolyl cis-trans isomerase B (cyclophilin B)
MCSNKPKEPILVIQTNYGNIKVKLYNETPGHRDNFIKKAEEGFYKDLTFHRVIEEFMIQGGNPATRNASDTTFVEDEKMRDTIPAEIKYPELYHKRGALAAARWGDDVNPTWVSDASQFYIVTGKLVFDEKLDEIEKMRFEDLKKSIYSRLQSANMDTIKALYRDSNRTAITELRTQWAEQAEEEAEERKSETQFTAAQREYYQTKGGTPHLDGKYTVFGEVVEGMDVVDKIQKVKTNAKDRPLQSVVMNIVVLEK